VHKKLKKMASMFHQNSFIFLFATLIPDLRSPPNKIHQTFIQENTIKHLLKFKKCAMNSTKNSIKIFGKKNRPTIIQGLNFTVILILPRNFLLCLLHWKNLVGLRPAFVVFWNSSFRYSGRSPYPRKQTIYL
jgi:hypothetical protein